MNTKLKVSKITIPEDGVISWNARNRFGERVPLPKIIRVFSSDPDRVQISIKGDAIQLLPSKRTKKGRPARVEVDFEDGQEYKLDVKVVKSRNAQVTVVKAS